MVSAPCNITLEGYSWMHGLNVLDQLVCCRQSKTVEYKNTFFCKIQCMMFIPQWNENLFFMQNFIMPQGFPGDCIVSHTGGCWQSTVHNTHWTTGWLYELFPCYFVCWTKYSSKSKSKMIRASLLYIVMQITLHPKSILSCAHKVSLSLPAFANTEKKNSIFMVTLC